MAKSCLIYEALNDVKKMDVKKEGDLMTLTGVFGVCGVRNNNQRVYEAKNYTQMISEMKERIERDGGIPGELEHPNVMNITLENVSHKITDINIDKDGVVTGSITLLNTPKGQIAQAIVEGGLPLFISSRASGNVDSRNGNVTLERIATYDLVGTPGFSQARLSLNENQETCSINESMFYITEKENNIEETDMELNEIMEKFEDMQSQIDSLRAENEELREAIEKNDITNHVENIADSIQKWITEEYSEKVQEWIEDICLENLKEDIAEQIEENAVEEGITMDEVKEYVSESVAPKIQEWITEEFAPKIQEWIMEEYSAGVDTWIQEHVVESMKENMKGMIQEAKTSNLTAIDKTLKVLESIETTKPTYTGKAMIMEGNLDEPKFIQEMPATMRVKWDMASNEVKESIMRRAKLYNLVNEGAIARFWENINFDNIRPVQNIYEGLDNIMDAREREIRAKIRSSRFRK